MFTQEVAVTCTPDEPRTGQTRRVAGCVVGLGPAGLGVMLGVTRARAAGGMISGVGPIVGIDAGPALELRACTILAGKGCQMAMPCHVVSGVGGSSVLSGGKVSSFPAGRNLAAALGGSAAVENCLREAHDVFASFVPLEPPGVAPDVVEASRARYAVRGFELRYYDAFTYRAPGLAAGYRAMLEEIRAGGGEVHLETRVTRVARLESGYRVEAEAPGGQVLAWETPWVALGVGRLGKELLGEVSTALGLGAAHGRTDVGVRIEFPATAWRNMDACHRDLKLHFGGARTFCVCPNGYVAPYRVNDIFVVEGHSGPDIKTGFSNLAVTVRYDGKDGVGSQAPLLAEVRTRLLRQTGGIPVRQRLADYLAGNSSADRVTADERGGSSITYWRWGNAHACYPEGVAARVRNAVSYFVERALPPEAAVEASVFAPELDYYWPQCPVGPGFESAAPGVYVVGDGTGLFRGILQSFASGLACAEHLVSRGAIAPAVASLEAAAHAP